MKLKFIDQFVSEQEYGNNCSISGRISSTRRHGKLIFLDLTDHTGKIQIIIEKNKHRDSFKELSHISPGSYISVSGKYLNNKNGDPEVNADKLEILSKANLNLPTPWEINGLDPKHGKQIFNYTGIYVANPQRAAILKIKTDFITALHQYFQRNRFTLVEPPIITDKTLYSIDNAIQAKVHGEDVFLTQCATFELEPLAMVYKKVYTLSPAFRNEMSGSKRHLAEYTHGKAELLLADTEDLMFLAGDSIFNALAQVRESGEKELKLLGIDLDIEGLKPENHERITYDEALKITHRKGSATQYGEGLKRPDELILTEHVGNKYLWVQFPPFESEGFPYKRHPTKRHLSMTCDLIAPHGAGEMVGVAEKITNAEELIINLIEKGKKDQIRHYWEYIMLRQYGLPEHGGLGLAPERIIYGLLNLDHIRLTKPWPRYPDRRITTPEGSSLPTLGNPELERIVDKYNL